MRKEHSAGLRTWWQDCQSCPGTFTAHAVVNIMPHPVCTMYFSFEPGPNQMHLLDIFTNHRFRREGIARRLLNDVVAAYEPRYVMTGGKSTPSGVKLVESLGFRLARAGVMKGEFVLKTGLSL